MPSFTFYASAEAVPHTGARPVFCDVDPDVLRHRRDGGARAHARDQARSCRSTCSAASPRRRAARARRRRGVAILEDAAQAAGARLDGRRAGSLGDAATFSFFPSKNLFCLGDGGAIATNDDGRRARRDLRVPRLPRQEHVHRGGVELPARRAPGGGAARDPGPARRLERAAAGRSPRLRGGGPRRAGRRAASRAEDEARAPPVRGPRRDRTSVAALAEAGIAARSYYRVPSTSSPRWRRGRRRGRAARHHARCADEPRAADGPDPRPAPHARWSKRCVGRPIGPANRASRSAGATRPAGQPVNCG